MSAKYVFNLYGKIPTYHKQFWVPENYFENILYISMTFDIAMIAPVWRQEVNHEVNIRNKS